MQRSRGPVALDLDQADGEVRQRWFVWTAAGLTVEPVKWTGHNDAAPATPPAGPSAVQTPRTLGVHVSRPAAHVDVVLRHDGWAEVAVLRPEAEAVVHTTVHLQSVPAFGQLLDRAVELITWSGVPKDRVHPNSERAAQWVLGYAGDRYPNEGERPGPDQLR